MQLLVDFDVAYLVLPKVRSRIAGYFRLTDKPSKLKHYTDNGAILIECYTPRHVVTSAAEAETKRFFIIRKYPFQYITYELQWGIHKIQHQLPKIIQQQRVLSTIIW